MITRSSALLQRPETPGADVTPLTLQSAWQNQLSRAIRDPRELCRRLGLDDTWLPGAEGGHALFEVRVPEGESVPGYVADPLEEAAHTPGPGLIHKYAGRVLLIASPACAVNCRYCFRRHFPYDANSPSRAQWEGSLDTLRSDPSIREAILSGGDPLAASDRQLAWLVERLEAIPHLERLRLHTRLPVVIPDRVDDVLLDWLGNTRLQKVMVLHINHAQEIDQAVVEACARLKAAGVTLLNQSVLLRGVNDSMASLAELSERLFEAGVLPYYLHVLDPVAGAAHFDVPDEEARELVAGLRAMLPGFLLPRLVREIPGEASKTPL